MDSARPALAALLAYGASIPLANLMVQHVGNVEFPGGPHVIPVAPGLSAPSGVLAIGVALVARDAVHRYAGWRAALSAIVLGVALSAAVAPSVAAASAVAFGVGELADMAIYAPLRRYRPALAILASGTVGALVDSLAFLWIAFGSVAYWQGNTIGKVEVSAVAARAHQRAVSDRLDPAVR